MFKADKSFNDFWMRFYKIWSTTFLINLMVINGSKKKRKKTKKSNEPAHDKNCVRLLYGHQ